MNLLPLMPSRLPVHPLALATALSTLLGSAWAQKPPAVTAPPAPIAAMQQFGVEVIGPLKAQGSLQAWAGQRQGQPLAMYLTPDGKHVVTGVLLDADGKDVNRPALEALVQPALDKQAWDSVQATRWVADGSAKAPRVVYVFTDPNCPYCNKFWADARPWVEAGKVQLRHILVGVIRPDSAGKAAAVLASKDPAAALAAHAKLHGSGRIQPVDGRGLQPLQDIPASIRTQLAGNQQAMVQLGLSATPALVWKDAQGQVHTLTGAPEGRLAEVLGAKP
ncbi:MAG: thiol:disulfide interchange protein DsbG [Comamonas sp.]